MRNESRSPGHAYRWCLCRHLARALGLGSLLICLALTSASSQLVFAQAPRVVLLNPSTRAIQTVVASSPEGSTFIFSAGVYRNLSIAVKNDDTFLGMPGAVLNGSEPLTFVRKGELWVAQANPALDEAVSPGVPCDPALENADGSKYTVGCTHSRSLYRDDTPLWRVETISELGPGKWFFHKRTGMVYISEDPQSDTLELGEMPDAFHGAGQNVTIKGLTIEKYAGAQQHGALNCESGNWLIQGNVIQLNHARGIGFGHCDGIRILGNTVSRNGNLGIGGYQTKNAIVEGNEIDGNNYARIDRGWEAGGGKWSSTTDLVVSNNSVRDNLGPGLWSDIGAEGTLYSGNLVMNNSSAGIFYEIGRHARIEKNTVAANGNPLWRDPWLWDAQILVSTSSDVVVENNIVFVTKYGNGITIVDQNRGTDAIGELRASNNRVIGNSITYEGDTGTSGGTSDREKTFQNNNVFDANTYHFLGAKGPRGHFYWAGSPVEWEDFRLAGNEKSGHVVTGK